MRRYRHYLTRPTRNDWPANVYCVAADRDGNAMAARLLRRGGVYQTLDTTDLRGPVAWHKYLSQTVCSGGAAVIISYRCSRAWVALQLWELLEDGRITITTDPAGRTQETDSTLRGLQQNSHDSTDGQRARVLFGLQRHKSPYLVTEDPPNIIGFRWKGRPGVVTWIDTRNYGVEFPNAELRQGDLATEIGRWFIDMSEESQRLNLGSFRPTAGSQAMHGWRRYYMPRGCYAHADADALSLEHASYVGGRTECFQLGAIPFTVGHYDMRSAYGSVMDSESLPVRLCRYVEGSAAMEMVRQSFDVATIADVTVETDEPAYPYRRGTDTIWPVGRFRTTLPGPELVDALLRHRIVAAYRAASYQCEPACQSYASDLYRSAIAAKLAGRNNVAAWVKRLLVSLPGKLGQRNRQWVEVKDPGTTPPYGSWWATDADGVQYRCRAIAGRVYREVTDGFAPDAMPAVASWITSSCRLRLLNLVRAAGWERTVYVDTDAIVCDATGSANLRIAGYACGDGLGQLREVYIGSGLHVYGPKHYTEGTNVVFAGLPRGSIVDCGDGVHYEYTPPITDELRTGHRPLAVPTVKRYPGRERYTLGSVGAGGIVSPHHVWED